MRSSAGRRACRSEPVVELAVELAVGLAVEPVVEPVADLTLVGWERLLRPGFDVGGAA
jgi:hypothetical protein